MDIALKMKDSGWRSIIRSNYKVDSLLKTNSKCVVEDEVLSGIIRDTRNVILAFNLGAESKEARMEALKIIKPVTYKQANNFIKNAERIIDANEDYLTFPKTVDGIKRAYMNTILRGSLEDVVFLFAVDETFTLGLYHAMVLSKDIDSDKSIGTRFLQDMTEKMIGNDLTLKETPKVKPETPYEIAARISKEQQQQKQQLEKENEQHKEPVNTTQSTPERVNDNVDHSDPRKADNGSSQDRNYKKNNSPAVFFKKEDDVQQEINHIRDSIEKILEPIRADLSSYKKNKDFASFKIREVFDNSARQYSFKNGSLDPWFTDILLESQYDILYKNKEDSNNTYFSKLYLEMLVDCSSELTEMGLDTRSVMNDKKFWYALKVVRENVPPVDYKLFTNCLVSNFLTLKSYTDVEKIEVGMDAVGMVFKDELNFKSRLNLWLDIGGGLNIADKDGKTIVDSLKAKNNKMWNKVVIEIAKERDVNLHRHFPKDFERIDTFNPTQEDVLIARRTNLTI